ncbi:MAG: hypothetical protein IJC24_07790 [Clostridia bacterium]|nr:hypothetical protein [Clostridia bacterium]
MARAFPIELIEKLSKDESLEPIFYKEDKLRFYCAGGNFLTLSKIGCPTKHEYFDYFDTEEQRDAFKNEKDAAKAYDPASCIYRYSKKAMDNRAHDIRPLGEKKKNNNPLERLYQQKIALNNRPGKDNSCGVASFSFGISSEYLWGEKEIETWKESKNKEKQTESETEEKGIDKSELDEDLAEAQKGNRPAPTFIDLVWVDEANRKIVFIEYKMKPASLNGKSGVEDHCAKTFLSMNNEEVKKDALARYYAKKEFHSGNLTCRAQDFKDQAAKDIEGYESICCLMFSDIEKDQVRKTIIRLKKSGRTTIKDIMQSKNQEKAQKISIDKCFENTYYIYQPNHKDIVLSLDSFIPITDVK